MEMHLVLERRNTRCCITTPPELIGRIAPTRTIKDGTLDVDATLAEILALKKIGCTDVDL
jgi:hypothetical protein